MKLRPRTNVLDLTPAAGAKAALAFTRAVQTATKAIPCSPSEGRLLRAAAPVVPKVACISSRLAPLVPAGVAGAVLALAFGPHTGHELAIVPAGLVDGLEFVYPKATELLV